MSDPGRRLDFVALAFGDARPASPTTAYVKVKVIELGGQMAFTGGVMPRGEYVGHVALLPAGADVSAQALEIVDRKLHLHGTPLSTQGLDYALIEVEPTELSGAIDGEALWRRVLQVWLEGRTTAMQRVPLANRLEGVVEDLKRQIQEQTWLRATDRWRVIRAVERLPQAIGTGDFQAWARSIDGGGGLESHTVAADDGAPPPVHWNVRLLDGERALVDPFVEVGRRYTIESGLDAEAASDAIAGGAVGSEIPDGTEVTFVIACDRAILRADPDGAGAPDTAAFTRVAPTARYDAATRRCGPVRVGVVPDAAGPVTITLDLVTGNSTRASSKMPLWIGPGESRPMPVIGPTTVTASALVGPQAELQLELLPSGELALSGGAMSGIPCQPASAPAAIATDAILARQQLVALSHRYQPDPAGRFAIADAARIQHAMAKIGAALHQTIFGHPDDESVGEDLKKLARAIADTPQAGQVARLQIKAAFQPFPWGVFYDGVYRGTPLTDDPASVDPACFWGRRFRIDRAIYGHVGAARAPVLAAPVRVQSCLNPHLDAEQAAFGVRVVEQQRALFDGFAGAERRAPVETAAGFKTYLQAQPGGPCDLLYVFCHATAAHVRDDLFTFTGQAPDTQAKLVFEPGGAVDVATMKALRMKPLSDRPLVVLNACSSAQGDEAFQAPMLEHFLDRWKALGVIGTDWEVPTVFADAFARQLFGYFLGDRAPLGEALARAAADAFADGNPFPLIYAVYARPDILVKEA